MLGFPGSARGDQPWERRREAPLFADGGMVVAAHPLTTSAGLAVLEDGGNAVDAAVAAALVAAVVMPEMCGLGGDLFAIVSAKNNFVALHGSGIAPRSATIELMRAHGDEGGKKMPYRGPLAAGVPGMVDGYFTLLERYGSKPFAELAERAIWYAGHGFPLTRDGAEYIAESQSLLEQFPASAAVFLPNSTPPKSGNNLKQEDLAKTLKNIADKGVDAFYRGEIAKQIAEYMAANGGAMSCEDLADHRTNVSTPIMTTYRDYTVYQTALPTQGLILLEALNLAERVDLAKIGPWSADGVHFLAEAKKIAYADRLAYACDPAFGHVPLDQLLSKSWAAERFREIDPNRAADDVRAGELQHGDTTYLCVVDRDGMMVSLIQSVSANFGCGVVVDGTGIVLNNRVGRGFSLEEGHPNLFAPGKKTMHTLNCYLIADANDTPVLVGGTPGGDGQPQWNLQVISGLIDAGLDVQAAIEAPRWTSWPGTDPLSIDNPFELRVEDRLPEKTFEGLSTRGHVVKRIGPWDGGGSAQAIARDPKTRVLAAGSDPRVEGCAAGF
ncbi:MAG: gamma-glutamyltransferase [Thermomicrobiales bacterium]